MNHRRETNWQITSFEVSRVHLICQTSLLYSSCISILSYPLMTRPISPTEGPMDPGKKLIGSLALQQVKSDLHSIPNISDWVTLWIQPSDLWKANIIQASLVSWILALKIQEQYNGNFSERSETPSGWWIQTVSPWRGTLAQLRLEKKNNDGQHTSPIYTPLTQTVPRVDVISTIWSAVVTIPRPIVECDYQAKCPWDTSFSM